MGSDGATADPQKYPAGTYKKDELIDLWLAAARGNEDKRRLYVVRVAYEAAGRQHQREPTLEERYDDGLSLTQRSRISFAEFRRWHKAAIAAGVVPDEPKKSPRKDKGWHA